MRGNGPGFSSYLKYNKHYWQTLMVSKYSYQTQVVSHATWRPSSLYIWLEQLTSLRDEPVSGPSLTPVYSPELNPYPWVGRLSQSPGESQEVRSRCPLGMPRHAAGRLTLFAGRSNRTPRYAPAGRPGRDVLEGEHG